MTSVGARTGLLAHLERPLPGWITNGHDLPRKELKVRLNTGMDAQALESLAITHGPFFPFRQFRATVAPICKIKSRSMADAPPVGLRTTPTAGFIGPEMNDLCTPACC